ncbi:sporulation integral membrane protein YtvI [Mesobacillus maritimus]|uniref:Sporulation integral membrane protein YtvI n=1 Tax=Mesobacillus maritimus TaxID=1643336 RepID=A0ABS7K6B1_9BACI|nr:sporulation integral membrane protein YtvI [Mesobacillus maritimus]MBY0097754.1 sporulation integral membrane protein YtvI [Mesobacillus maritimus]
MTRFVTKRNISILIAIILIALLFYIILPVSVPLISALFTAIILEPLVRFIKRRTNIGRKFAVIIIFIGFLILIGLSGYFITTKVITEAINIVENAPRYINDITNAWFDAQDRFVEAAKDFPDELVHEVNDRGEEFLLNARDDLLAFININNLKALLTNIPNFLVSFLVYLIALFLFLLDLPRLRNGFYSFLSERTAEKVNFMTSRLSNVITGFFKAQFLVSVIIFVVSFLGLLLIVPELALFMSLIIWLIDFIPIIGSIVILGPWAIFHLLAGDIVIGTKLAILAAVLLIIRRTVEPKVMGTHIGLSPLATLIAMYLGLKLIGMAGFIVGPLLIIAFNTAREAGIIKMNFKI